MSAPDRTPAESEALAILNDLWTSASVMGSLQIKPQRMAEALSRLRPLLRSEGEPPTATIHAAIREAFRTMASDDERRAVLAAYDDMTALRIAMKYSGEAAPQEEG